MIIRELTHLAVADQLTLDDLDAVKDAGFKAVICNRPDEEGEPHAEAESWQKRRAYSASISMLPVNGGNITD